MLTAPLGKKVMMMLGSGDSPKGVQAVPAGTLGTVRLSRASKVGRVRRGPEERGAGPGEDGFMGVFLGCETRGDGARDTAPGHESAEHGSGSAPPELAPSAAVGRTPATT